ncbi:uncharacterized protein LOC142318300 [Lycorma delicatula]|uniref:uncharacterized protein LOC142318300 n=1 Tax=Lycorma delicatula TaxID=130591 RepID=UPI003F5123B8
MGKFTYLMLLGIIDLMTACYGDVRKYQLANIGKLCTFRPKRNETKCEGEVAVKIWYFNNTDCIPFMNGCTDGITGVNLAFITLDDCLRECKQEQIKNQDKNEQVPEKQEASDLTTTDSEADTILNTHNLDDPKREQSQSLSGTINVNAMKYSLLVIYFVHLVI